MKGKPQIHFWRESIDDHVVALNCCRSWDVPANGVFMLFVKKDIRDWSSYQRARQTVAEKLEARERALVAYYGRSAKHYLDQIELTPAEKRARQASINF